VATSIRLQQSKIYVEQDMSEADLFNVATGSVGFYSSRSPGKDTVNEDSGAVISVDGKSCVLAVADGAGGMRAGAQASSLALDVLKSTIDKAVAENEDIRNAVLNGIEKANKEICALGIGANTTLAVADIQGSMIRTYHVGDSMILVTGQKGKNKLQTISHSPVGYAVESGYLDEQEALHHEDRHLVLNMLGTPEMRIEIGPVVELAPQDTLLIASDGLFDNLHIDEIVERMRKGPLDKCMQTLVDDSHKRMLGTDDKHPSKPDDLTCILFRLGSS